MKNFYKNPKLAVLVIDMLNAFFQEGSALFEVKEGLLKNINEIVDSAHKAQVPVVWVRQEYKHDLSDAPLINRKKNELPSTIEGEPSAQLLPELHQKKEDQIVVKKRYSAFFKTNLEQILDELGVNTLIIAGVNSMTCVRTAVNDAYQLDYEVILALDCVAGYDPEQHSAAIKYMQYSQSTGMRNQEILAELAMLN